MKPVLIDIMMCCVAEPTLKSWLAMRLTRRTDQHIHLQVDVAQALAQDPICFMHPVSDSEAKVIKADLVGGLLLARRSIGRIGFTAELVRLGGCRGDERRIAALPSVGLGIAANLAVLHALGIEDLASSPRGGYGWRLEKITQLSEGGDAPAS